MIAWALVFVLVAYVVQLRARLELVARAEHELRGPLTAFELALESARRGRPVGEALDSELARARVALADLTAARRGRRARCVARRFDLERLARSAAAAWGARVEWRAGPAPVVSDEGRVAQALGNLLANAVEHGAGDVTVCGVERGGQLQLVVANGERGRGLAIAADAARDAGATLTLDEDFTATLELAVAP